MAGWWIGHDLLLTPTLGAPPPELGWFTEAGPEEEGARIASFIPYTPQFNMTGQPAVSLPLHWTPGGLPVGVHSSPPTDGKTSSSASPANWSRPRPGATGTRPCTRSKRGVRRN